MAYACPRDLDGFMVHLPKPDTKLRQQVGSDLIAYLAEPSNPITCQDIGQLVDGIIPWIESSNFKVSGNGIEVMTYLADRLGHDFRPYLQTVLPSVIDRLGDARDAVREKSQLLILKLLEREVLSPQTLLERLTPGFSHKNAKIREEVLRCLVNTLNEHGAQSVTLNKFIPHIVKLLSDPTSTVRDTALQTLVDLYKHVGEKLRADLQKRNLVPASKLPTLLARFDEAREGGKLLPTASTVAAFDLGADELDRMAKPIVPVKKAGLGSAMKRTASTTRGIASSNAANAGAVDEDMFLRSFEDVPQIQLFGQREVNEHMKNIQETISDTNKDWNKRADALKKIRSLVIAGAADFDDFHTNLRNLEIPLQGTIKDLRSQVVREACISIAFLSQSLGSRFDHAAESLLSPLINLIQNSAKIMSTSGTTCVRFIIQHTQSPRIIPIITTHLQNSKSKEIRRTCCEFLDVIFSNWPTHPLERHIAHLQESVKKGIGDADPEARLVSRKAFRGFRDHFPEQAEALLQSLEPSYRKALQGELCLSSSSSSGSLAQTATMRSAARHRSPMSTQSSTGSTENLSGGGTCGLQRAPSLPRSYSRQRSGIPVLSNSGKKGFRSTSAIDLQAAQRAKARAQYSAMARQKIASGTASLPRPRKSPDVVTSMQSPERMGRTRSRNMGVSHSQPTSRSGSPSSRMPYLYGRTIAADGGGGGDGTPRARRMSSGIPRSTQGSRDTSRETSPSRGSGLTRFRKSSDHRPPLSPASRPPVMAQRILQQSREAESALADALSCDMMETDYPRMTSPRKSLRSIDNHSDDSETSSVCSERSFDSMRRPSDSYSWSGSQQRLSSRDYWEPCHDINEIIALCASTVWLERKDGLVSLRHYLSTGNSLSPGELKHITEICTKMFMDSHTKGLSVVLDTVNEMIRRHRQDLHDWLYVLLQRLFYKSGTDLLISAQNKLSQTLDNVKRSFPSHLQLLYLYKFLVDVAQTPKTKVKVEVLNYLAELCAQVEPGQFVTKPPAAQALQKIIAYSQDAKSSDLRNAAKKCVVALWNCNTPQVMMMLAELPKDMEDIASAIVQSHMRKNSTGSDTLTGSPKPLSPILPLHNNDLNREEIYRSLKRTTAEIQNYSYETLGSKLDRDRDTTSQDSGISQMSLGNDVMKNEINAIEERMEELSIRPAFGGALGPRTEGVNGVSDGESNRYMHIDVPEDEVVANVLDSCVIDNPMPLAEKCKLLDHLVYIIKQGKVEPIVQNFKKLLRIFLDTLGHNEPKAQVVVLQVLSEIFKNKNLEECWCKFIELLTLRVLDAYCSDSREVVKMAEMTTQTMNVFPLNTIVSTLSPLIRTSPFPRMDGAIKMLTKLIELHTDKITDDHLHTIMPGLIQANDHEQSTARKSAVFCMVAIHKKVGEERLAPHIASLSGSRLKLLKLYIEKEQQKKPSSKSGSRHNSANSATS